MRTLTFFLVGLAALALWADDASPAPAPYHELLLRAVKEHRLVTFVYDGEELETEPHAYGLSRAEKPLLRAYVPRPSKAGDGEAAWLLFRVDRMSHLKVSDQTFEAPRTGYRRGDKTMAVIYAEF